LLDGFINNINNNWLYNKIKTKVIVVIAQFRGPEETYGLRNQILEQLNTSLQADLDSLTALRSFSDYATANQAYALQKLESTLTDMKSTQDAELAPQNTLAFARDAASATEWDLHNMLLGAKDQVIAQYGSDSDQVQSLGLKKKSEYKALKRKAKKAAA